MLALKYLLLTGAIGLFIAAIIVLAFDYAENRRRCDLETVRWRTKIAMAALAWAPMLMALSFVGGISH